MIRICLPKLKGIKIPSRTLSTVDNKEIDHFQNLSGEWWDELGPLKPLHALNQLRVPLVRDGLLNTHPDLQQRPPVSQTEPLKGLSIMDIGCGAGILSEPLARIGASVTGVDPNSNLIKLAAERAQKQNLANLEYICEPIEELSVKYQNKFDALVASEVIEHVTKKQEFLQHCVTCIKPGGSIFLTTINQTAAANFCAIFLAENVLGAIPKGTHQYEKLVPPQKLQRILEDLNCKTVLLHGSMYNSFTNKWFWIPSTSIFYALQAVKLQ